MQEESRRDKTKIRAKSKITKMILLVPLIVISIFVLNISGTLAYFTDRISFTNIFTVKDSHTVTYRYYEVDEINNITTLQASKSKVYFDGSRITLGEDSEYFINNSNKYESVTYKIGNTEIQNTYTTTSSNVTIDQYYQLKRYTVSYNLDGGTVKTANPTVYTEKTETFTLNNPTKTGYTFAGWTGSNSSTPQTAVTITKGSTGNRTYTANWSINSYKLTVNPNGGSWNSSTGISEITQNVNSTLQIPVPTKVGYTFNGWTKTGNGEITTATPISTTTQVFTFRDSDTTLTANWSANTNTTYTVEHYVMGTDGTYPSTATSTESKTGTTDSTITVANLKKTTSAYNITNGIIYAEGKVNNNVVTTTTVAADGTRVIKLYYKRTYGTLTTAKGTNVSSVTTQNSVRYYYGATVPALTATLSSQTGYDITFSGWNTSNSNYIAASGTNPKASFTWPAMPEGTSITLTANATKTAKIYTITLDNQSADVTGTTTIYEKYSTGYYLNSSATTQMTTSSNGITLPEKTGYTFKGYYTATSGGTQYINDSGKITSNASTTYFLSNSGKLYAQWEKKGNTITYYSNGGTFSSGYTNYSATYDSSTTFTPEVIATKYSHTVNVDDTGKKNSDYGNNWWEHKITGTDRGELSNAHVVTIPGATSLSIEIYYNGESTSWDWASIWEGSHPEYTALQNYNSAGYIAQKLGGSQSGSYTVNGNTLTNMGKATYTISGDTVTFGFYSDASSCGQGYGYYAIIKGLTNGKSESYMKPTRTGYGLIGWNTNSSGTGTTYATEKDAYDYIIANNTSLTLYAMWGTQYTVMLNSNGATAGTSSIKATKGSKTLDPVSITLPTKNESVTLSISTDTTSSYATTRRANGASIKGDTSSETAYSKFLGWYTSSSGGSKVIDSLSTPSLVASVSNYTDSLANWIKESATTLYARFSYPVASKTLPTVTKENYTCGWTTSQTGTTISRENGADMSVAADYTYYPVCVPNDTTPPTLSLSPLTSKSISIDSNWTLSHSSISDSVVTVGSDGKDGFANTPYIDVNYGFYYMTFDAYATNVTSNYSSSSKGGVYWMTYYYDSNKALTTSLDNYQANGHVAPLTLSTWTNNILWHEVSAWKGYKRYGPNVKYIRIQFKTDGGTYSKLPVKVRNLIVYGETMPNSWYDINVTATDDIGVTTRKYASGTRDASYFTSSGTTFTGDSIRVTSNGTYTVYVADEAGNSTVETITISNIN